jgi:hypothetical protein
MDILAGLLASPQGQSLAKQFLDAKDVAGDVTEYVMDAPARTIANVQDPQELTPGNVVSSAADLAMILAGGVGAAGLGKMGAAALTSGKPFFKDAARMIPGGKAIGPDLPMDAANYTAKHTDVAREVMRKKMMDPNAAVNSKSLAKDVGDEFGKRGLNYRDDLEGLAKGTMRRMPDELDLSDPNAVNRALEMATGVRRAGKPVTFGMAGAAAGGAMSDEEIEALLAEIMGGGR